ncbi:MAG TPA: hypothetical protein VFY89_11050, partial [Ktedonobacterales bacterium]
RATRIVPVVGAALLVLLLAFLVGCGGTIPGQTVQPGPTSAPTVAPTVIPTVAATAGATATSPASTPTPGEGAAYAYLYSRVDYPLQVPVNAGDTVTLTLSPYASILTLKPATGTGSATIGEPIPLPTDPQDYQDIAASVEASAPPSSPLVWQLTSPLRQSLLLPVTNGGLREYAGAVNFTWQVRAVAPGQNQARLILHLIYVYLDGSEHAGAIQVSQAPLPIVAVAGGPVSSNLLVLKVPLVSLSGFAGLLGALRFIWGLFRGAKEAKETAETAAKLVGSLQSHTRQRGGAPRRGRQLPPDAGV